MRLTKTTSHAIRILIDCTEAAGTLVKVAEIAKRLDITAVNVFKIVHILSRAGFVESVRGRYGGVRLTRAAGSVRIGHVVRAIEATEMEVAGADKVTSTKGRDAKPQLNGIFDDALEAFISVLDQHTLADMAKDSRATSAKSRNRTTKSRARLTKIVGKNVSNLRS